MAYQDTYNQKSLVEQNLVNTANTFQKKLIEAIRGEDEYRKGSVRAMPLSELPFFGVGSWASTLSTGASSLFRIADVNYYLELYFDNQLITTIGFPFDPSSVIIQRPEATLLTHTFGGIIRESAETKINSISIIGQSGYAERLGYTRSGSYCYENGEVILHEFDEFLKSYNYLCSIFSNSAVTGSLLSRFKDTGLKPFSYLENRQLLKSGNENSTTGTYKLNKNLFLVLRCVKEDLALKVEPTLFSYRKATNTNKFGYVYELKFNSYGNYGLATRDNFITAALKLAAAKVRMVAGLAAVAKNILLNIEADYVAPILGLFNALDNVCREFNGMISAGKGLGEGVIAIANEIVNLVNSIQNTLSTVAPYTGIGIIGPTIPVAGGIGQDLEIFPSGTENTTTQYSQKENEINELINSNQMQFENAQKALINSNIDIINLTEQLQNNIFAKNNKLKQQLDNLQMTRRMLIGFDYDVSQNNQANLSSLKSVLNQLYYAAEGVRSLIPKDFDTSKLNNYADYTNYSSTFDIDEQESNYSTYVLKENENLRTVAFKFFGNTDGLSQLIFLNGWLDALRKGDGSYAAGGDVIKIPGGNQNIYKRSSYEVDIKMPYDDIKFDTTENDIKLSYGIENIEQQIKNLFLTGENELMLSLGYGLASLIGVQNIPFLKTKIKQQILADTRFKGVQFNDISVEGDKLLINIDVKLKTDNSVNINTIIAV